MANYHRFTNDEIATIINLKEQRLTNKDVALYTGKTEHQIRDLLFRLKKKGISPQEDEQPVPVRPEKTLKDFDPRDMFRQLYDLGYRIDDKGIYIMVKQYVNLKSIISE